MDFPIYSAPYLTYQDPLQQTTNQLHGELMGLFRVLQITSHTNGQIITFSGELLQEAETTYSEIERRFQPLGYTPLLRHERGQDLLIAVEGVNKQVKNGNLLIHLLLLLATILTTLAAGASLWGASIVLAVQSGSVAKVVETLGLGVPFAGTLLGILGVHELGHYAVARLYGVSASLPYFIPTPLMGLGTLGAFISIKSPLKNRTVLFDIGLAGPIAGLMVAVPLLLLGLWLSPTVPAYFGGEWTLRQVGSSLFIDMMVALLKPVPAGQTLALHPIFFAAWFGLLITGINLLPVGQLDGGHVAYALLGRFAITVGSVVLMGLLVAGALLSSTWYMWAFFVLLGGLRHPQPLNDVTPLDPVRKILSILAIGLFWVLIVPAPFQ